MTGFDRLCVVMLAGLLGWWIARALHIPVWTGWQMGDRMDMALVCAVIAYVATKGQRA